MLMLLRELYKNAMYQASVHHMMLRKHGHLVGNYSSVLPGVLWDHKTVCLLLIVHLLHVGDILLLRENHLVALALCALALVAHFSEGEVVVEASQASPVSNSLLDLLDRGGVGLGGAASFLLTLVFGVLIFTCCLNFLQETLLFSLGSLVR